MDPESYGWPGVASRPTRLLRNKTWEERRRRLEYQYTQKLVPSSAQAQLGYDILASIMRVARGTWLWRVVVALMQTCKTLYREGTQLLLTENVHLCDHQRISSFSSFILHAEPALIPYFRNRLYICVDVPDSPIPDHLARSFGEALMRCTHLRSLHILELDPLIRSYPDLSAFLSLPALEDLFIQTKVITRHQPIAKFLRRLRCPLKCVRLQCFVEDHGKSVDYRREADPLWLFAGVAATLETFALSGSIQIGTIHLYPSVKQLHVLVGPTPILRPFITSFPALRTLVLVPAPCPSKYAEMDRFLIDFSLEGHWDPKDENFPIWERFREANRQDQLINGSWGTLDTLISNSLVARTLGLICHVRRVHLLLQFDPANTRVIMTVAHVLRDTQPDCLRLAFYRLDIEIVLDMMEHLIYVRSMLSALEVRLNIAEGSFDAKQYLEQLAHALRHSMITSLRIELVCFKEQYHRAVTECHERGWRQGIHDYCIMEDTIRAADIQRVVQQFLTTVMNLRRMEIVWGSCYLSFGLDGGGVGIDLDVGAEVYDIPAEDHPDNWDATW